MFCRCPLLPSLLSSPSALLPGRRGSACAARGAHSALLVPHAVQGPVAIHTHALFSSYWLLQQTTATQASPRAQGLHADKAAVGQSARRHAASCASTPHHALLKSSPRLCTDALNAKPFPVPAASGEASPDSVDNGSGGGCQRRRLCELSGSQPVGYGLPRPPLQLHGVRGRLRGVIHRHDRRAAPATRL